MTNLLHSLSLSLQNCFYWLIFSCYFTVLLFFKKPLETGPLRGPGLMGLLGEPARPSLSIALKYLAGKWQQRNRGSAFQKRQHGVFPGSSWRLLSCCHPEQWGLISAQQITTPDVARANLASVCLFNHASFSAEMTLGCFGKLICIALPRRERAAGLQPMELPGSVC